MYYAADDTPVARQSILRPGTMTQSFSLYCYKHKCAILKRPHDWPTVASIHKWLVEGCDIPNSVEGARSHKRSFPKPPKSPKP